jgi:hypothetical protein
MCNRMSFKRAVDSAYIAREGDAFGIYVNGADLAHLEHILRRHRPADRNAILSDFYDHVAMVMSGELDAIMADSATRH